jgi:hypothetical protein
MTKAWVWQYERREISQDPSDNDCCHLWDPSDNGTGSHGTYPTISEICLPLKLIVIPVGYKQKEYLMMLTLSGAPGLCPRNQGYGPLGGIHIFNPES